MSSRQNFEFFIAGGGLSGTTTFDKLLNLIEANNFNESNDFSITICERGEKFGPGFPYDPETNGATLLNIYASSCTLNNGDKYMFLNWLKKKDRFNQLKEELSKIAPELCADYEEIDSFAFYPRFWFGRFMLHFFKKCLKRAKKLNVNVKLLPKHEVVNFNNEERSLTATYKNLETGEIFETGKLCHLFISTGIWEKHENSGLTSSPYFISNVYPLRKLKEERFSGKNIGILGSNTSAIDVVFEIMNANGKFVHSKDAFDWKYIPNNPEQPTKITLLSRYGRLPDPRTKVTPVPLPSSQRFTQTIDKIVQEHGRLRLKEFLELIENDLSEAYKFPVKLDDLVSQEPSTVASMEKCIDVSINGDLPNNAVGIQSILWCQVDAVMRVKVDCNGEELQVFNSKYWPILQKAVGGIPLLSSKRLLALMKAGVLDIKAVGTKWNLKDREDGLTINYNSKDVQESIDFDYMMDATGIEISVKKSGSELLKNSLSEGKIREYVVDMGPNKQGQKYNAGGIDIDTKDFSIYDQRGINHKSISYSGAAIGTKMPVYAMFLLNEGAEAAAKTITRRIQEQIIANSMPEQQQQ